MKNKGQTTIEFILLVTAVVAFMIYITLGNSSLFQSKLSNTVDITMTGMQSMASKLTAGIQSH